jgi:FAD/FMN-containing dehydrogenase
VPADELQDFEKDLKELEKTSKRKLAIFGCYSTGIYSVRPEFDMSKIDERRAALTLMRDFNLIVEDHKGSIAGGLPEGRLKPIVIYPELNANQKKIIKEIKKIFDKNNILSPNTKTNYDVRSAVRYLRTDSNNGIEF